MNDEINNEEEYSDSKIIIKKSREHGRNENRKVGSFFKLIILIVITSLISNMLMLYIIPKVTFFNSTPLYSKINENVVEENFSYVGPTYFGEGEDALTITEIVDRVGPAVVGVSTQSIVDSGFFGIQQQEGIGSGFIINEEGHILTNYHVVEGAQTVKVIFFNGVETDAKVINYDDTNDMALLKITDPTVEVPATVILGNSDELLVGESVVAIGSPLGKEFLGTTTSGIISALDRDVMIDSKSLKLLQTDTAINPGNSGGPLINSRGEVIGINTAKFGSNGGSSIEGIGFAIPINQAKGKLEELSKPILRIGIRGRVIDSNVSKTVNLPEGIYVVDVEPFSNAERAGLKAGDVILEFGGVKIKTFDDINSVKSKHNSGDIVKVKVLRGDKEEILDLTLTE